MHNIHGILLVVIVDFSLFFEQISWYDRFWAKRQVVDTGSPAGHIGRGPDAIRALWSVVLRT